MEKFDYSKNDIIQALLKVGVCKDDNIFVHSNLGFFGKLKDGISKEDYCTTFKEAIFEVIGIN